MKKFTKKLVASMLSTAMLMGMSLTAFAANSQTQGISVNGYSGPGRQITKTWSVAENGYSMIQKHLICIRVHSSDAIGTNASSTPTFNGSEMTQNNATKTAQIHQHGRQRQQAEKVPVKHCLMMSYSTELDLQLRGYITSC